MKKNSHRHDRLCAQIQRNLAQILQRNLKDPRVLWVSLTEVLLTPDYAHAKIFFSTLHAEEAPVVARILNQKAAFLRNLLAKHWTAHTLPQLHFVYDESLLQGQKMENLIQTALSQTAKE